MASGRWLASISIDGDTEMAALVRKRRGMGAKAQNARTEKDSIASSGGVRNLRGSGRGYPSLRSRSAVWLRSLCGPLTLFVSVAEWDLFGLLGGGACGRCRA